LIEKRYSSEAGTRFGLATALARSRDFRGAQAAFDQLVNIAPRHPMLDILAMRIKADSGDVSGALDLGKAALQRDSTQRPMRLAYAQLLQRAGAHQEALQQLVQLELGNRKDSLIYQLQAKSYAATGQQLLQHKAQAEAYYLLGAVPSAIEQLQMAQRLGGGDFYLLSSIDARLREMRQSMATQEKVR
jgi:predicted Zn-dependent protease